MKRCAVTTFLATAAILTAAPATASAVPLEPMAPATEVADDPMESEVTGSASESAQTGSALGLGTTGSTGTGSFGLPNLDKLLLGPFDTLCAVTGSAMTPLGKVGLGCDGIKDNKPPATVGSIPSTIALI
ncbi:hypothetical protein HLB23_27970 [Nocardia uniformis]|uniref:Secreted protein n=1 Tax=Nocardia uniformis TaxID=53432 RepID=A0A849C4L6_9NOCA|nr:hypothetical protein [Nocardia uniformis]NNH73644.1 hypothetical protein [Nocardia uniformis]